ncbi:hypothetical protein ZWY2020_002173 [Hordeum vulgare]|nr:hypothetical protein ZWY2020_002173 [Hordeum vulgare]
MQAGSKARAPDKPFCPELAGMVGSNPVCFCVLPVRLPIPVPSSRRRFDSTRSDPVRSMSTAVAALAVTGELALPLRVVGDLAATAGVSWE